jgi:hypothetical protein
MGLPDSITRTPVTLLRADHEDSNQARTIFNVRRGMLFEAIKTAMGAAMSMVYGTWGGGMEASAASRLLATGSPLSADWRSWAWVSVSSSMVSCGLRIAACPAALS